MHAFCVAGAVHRASWRSCGARSRRWPDAAFCVACAVHRASWWSCGARGSRWPAATFCVAVCSLPLRLPCQTLFDMKGRREAHPAQMTHTIHYRVCTSRKSTTNPDVLWSFGSFPPVTRYHSHNGLLAFGLKTPCVSVEHTFEQ